MTPQPFELRIPDTAIADLKTRLGLTRLPDAAPGAPPDDSWAFGTSVDYMRDLVSYWKDRFDWRAQEAALNQFPQFKLPLHDIDLHFLHVPGVGPNPYPLLLMHGWPGSVFEFVDMIPRLTDPARFGGDPRDAFTVIAPSLPGYGLSFKPGQKRFILQDIAACLHDLMTGVLGYRTFAAQGGDWGAGVASVMGQKYPSSLLGIHLNLLYVPRERVTTSSDSEARFNARIAYFLKEEAGYQQIQGTKPQTLSYGLTDSPVGLAGWILEKFHGWTVPPGSPEPPPFDLDRLLTNVMLYWLNGINASTWLYVALVDGDAFFLKPGEKIGVPTGLFLFPNDLLPPPPDSWTRRVYNVTHRREWSTGGHFAVFENGPLLADDMREFFRAYR